MTILKRNSLSKYVSSYLYIFPIFIDMQVSYSADSVKIYVAANDTTAQTSQKESKNQPGLTIEKTGGGNLITLNSSYSGPTIVTDGKWFVMGPLGIVSTTPITVSSGASLLGIGPITGSIINHGTISGINNIGDPRQSNTIRLGNTIGTLNITGSYTANQGARQTVEISGHTNTSTNVNYNGNPPVLSSSLINVSGNAVITDTYTFNVLLDAGTYKANSIVDYDILQTGGTLTTTGATFRLNQAKNDGLTIVAGSLNDPGQLDDRKKLILRLTGGEHDVIIANDQTESDMTGPVLFTLEPLTIGANDTIGENVGVANHDLTNTVTSPIIDTDFTFIFQSNSISDPSPMATADAFRFKSYSTVTTSSNRKNVIETLLTAISKNGPTSYERNETRLWISPYVNRSRTNQTVSDAGNQGWSGGSLVGLEQRDKKNIWTLGLLTGLMGSRSHTLGEPNTFSKTNGVLIGLFNTYKYTKKWGHELLINRTNTFINSQRYGLDKINQKTPFYALSSYKSTTDVVNTQINYLFDIIKKKVTCRLNTGVTYLDSQTGKIVERNSGINNLSTNASNSKSAEMYAGIGLRRVWEMDKITIRTTFVYEYGYEFMKKVSGMTTTMQELTQSTAPTTFITPIGPRQNKHYLQLNSSYLDRNSGLKFIMSYSGTLYKNVRNHTGMAKVEYRF